MTPEKISEHYIERRSVRASPKEWRLYLPYMPKTDVIAALGHEQFEFKQSKPSKEVLVPQIQKCIIAAWRKANDMDEDKLEMVLHQLVGLTWLVGEVKLAGKILKLIRAGYPGFAKEFLDELSAKYGIDPEDHCDGVRLESADDIFVDAEDTGPIG